MGGFTAVFIGVLIAGEDGGENGCTIAFRTASEERGRNQRSKLGHGIHAAHNGQTAIPAGEQEPRQTGWSGSAARLLPRATIGTALKQQPLVACRAVGRSPAKQGGL